jgi:spore maturation protein CgeB
MPPLRVLLTGNQNPWELTRSYERAFASLGHPTRIFDWYGRIERWTSRAPDRISAQVLLSAARRAVALDLLREARAWRPDVVLLLKTDDLPVGAIPLLRFAAPGVRVAAFHPDDPFNVDRLRGPSHPRAAYQMRAVDRYFVWSRRIVARARDLGVRADYLGFACDPAFTRPLPLTFDDHRRFGADVSFVGNWDPKREAWLGPLARAGDLRVAIWGGPDWSRRTRDPAVRACWRGAFANGEDFVRAVRASRAALNVLRAQNEGAENMRTYEIPACEAVMLAEHSEQQAAVFRPGEEAFYARDPQEAIALARRLASAPAAELEGVARAAARRALEHTYAVRAAEAASRVSGP